MATVRQTYATFADGEVVCWIEYDSVSLLVTSAGATNNAPQPAWIQATDTATGQHGAVTIQPGAELSANVRALGITGSQQVSPKGGGTFTSFPISLQARYPA